MLEKNKKSVKINFPKKKLLVIYLILLLHSLGIVVAFFRTDIPFHYHLLRFFSWWSVHTSIFTVLAAIMVFREEKLLAKQKKKTSSYFSQFITFLATMYNLITFCFWTYCLFFLSVEWEKSMLLNCQSVAWHFIAPLLTIFYFYLYARIDKLRKKIVKTLLLAFIAPVFYFFFACTLAWLNYGEKSSLFPYIKKYPYPIFEWIVKREWKQLITNFLIALVVFFSLCSFIIWTKIIVDDRKLKK